MTPREHPSLAGTTIMCTRHSVSRFVAGLRTVVISACRSAELQQLVGVTPPGTGTLSWSCTTESCQPIFAKTVSKNSVPPAPSGTGRGPDGSRQRVDLERGAAEELRDPRERDTALVDARPRTAGLRRTARPSARTETAPRTLDSLQRDRARRRVRERALELARRRLRVVELLGDDGELALRVDRDDGRRRDARHLEIRVVAAARKDRNRRFQNRQRQRRPDRRCSARRRRSSAPTRSARRPRRRAQAPHGRHRRDRTDDRQARVEVAAHDQVVRAAVGRRAIDAQRTFERHEAAGRSEIDLVAALLENRACTARTAAAYPGGAGSASWLILGRPSSPMLTCRASGTSGFIVGPADVTGVLAPLPPPDLGSLSNCT